MILDLLKSAPWALAKVFNAAVLALGLTITAWPAEPQVSHDGGPAPGGAQTIVVLGDSLAAGLGLDRRQAFPALLQEKIEAAGWKDKVVNAGVSGNTSADGVSQINWLLKQKIDILILELGGNDGLRGIPPAVTRTNLQTIIDRVKQKYPAARLVVAGMQMPPNMGPEYNVTFARIFPELAKANQAALVPFLLEGVGGNRELNQEDRIHPTADGQKKVADNVWKVLKPMLEQR